MALVNRFRLFEVVAVSTALSLAAIVDLLVVQNL
jgi:hypothetical protein